MGAREGRVTLDLLKFKLVPEALNLKFRGITQEEEDFQSVYDLCYQQVFGRHPGQSAQSCYEMVRALADKAACSVKLFVMANMLGHQLTWPDQVFTARTMVDNRALFRVATYSSVCIQKFGSLTERTLDLVAGRGLADYEIGRRLRASEALAGEWIINHRLFSDGLPYSPLFEALETQLDQNWLAIEPHYLDTFTPHISDPGDASERREHRHAVKQAMARLKKHRNQAFGNFRARERALPDTLGDVLAKFGYRLTDFEAANRPVTDPLHFWNRVGLAVQHYECLKLLNGQPNAYGLTGQRHPASLNLVEPRLRIKPD